MFFYINLTPPGHLHLKFEREKYNFFINKVVVKRDQNIDTRQRSVPL